MMKKVTVILPIYEVKGRTCKCIDSILNQTEKDLEIICVCFDKSVEAEVYKLGYGDKIIIKVCDNLKAIFDSFNGKYITIMNSNDYILPNMYKEMLDLNKNYEADIIRTSFFEIKECNNIKDLNDYINHQNDSAHVIKGTFKIEDNPELLWGKSAMFTTLYRREFVKSNDIELDEVLRKEYDDDIVYSFHSLAMLYADKIIWNNNAYYCHYIDCKRNTNQKKEIEGLESYKKALIVLNKKFAGRDDILKVYYAQYLNII